MAKHGSSGGDRASVGNEVLDVKPLRSLSPMFPTPFGNTSISNPGGTPFVCVSPFNPLSSSFQPGNPSCEASPAAAPFFASPQPVPKPVDESSKRNKASQGEGTPQVFPSFLTPPPMTVIPLNEDAQVSGGVRSSRGRKIKQLDNVSHNEMNMPEGGTSSSKKKHKRIKPSEHELMALPPASEDPKELVEVILMTFDALRRRMLQLDDASNVKKQPASRAGAVMSDYDLRANKVKRVGHVPGIEVSDIFYFRMEMLLVGLHTQSMAGIDCTSIKFGEEEDTVAVSIVSSGNYEDETDLVDSLVYSGQGGKVTDKKQADDQKLERGNLGLEKSLHRANEVRVIRGMKDPFIPTGKIYVYDGLYKVHGSWAEKGKSGFNIFKYKLVREPNQPNAFATWKMIDKWKENPSARGKVILPDLSSGEESLPVCLVNEVDSEKGPGAFSYTKQVKCLRPIISTSTPQACSCQTVCLPGDSNCSCALQNGGDLPFGPDGLLVSRKPLIYECSPSCSCFSKCRNRVTQKGIKFRFEVFKTRDRGWGLRSWDPIRSGSFICEYVGEIIDKVNIGADGEEDEFVFEASHSNEKSFQWNYGPELLGEPSLANLADAPKPLPIIISAKRFGNVARFMNHSCSPNVFWQPVQYGHGDESYPHIMFFASKHIPPMTELTYDYGLSGREAKSCLCGSPKCRGFFG